MKALVLSFVFFILSGNTAFSKEMNPETEKWMGLSDPGEFKSCADTKYDQVEVLGWTLLNKAGKVDSPKYAIWAMKKYNFICLQAKCLMKRDKISYADLVKKITATGNTPVMKKMQADAVKEMDLETCSQ